MTVCTSAQLNISRSCRGPPIVIKSSNVAIGVNSRYYTSNCSVETYCVLYYSHLPS